MQSPAISFSDNHLVVHSPVFRETCRIAAIGDAHYALSDDRDDLYRNNYARMAQYGKQDMEELAGRIAEAETKADVLLLAGDIISFPTLKNTETLAGLIQKARIPVLYTAGNHDWHFEGIPGSDAEQRETWTQKRLLPLYCGRNPLCFSFPVKGVRILSFDNSLCEILPEQLEFLKRELQDPNPVIVFFHVPIWLPIPGKVQSVAGSGCGHPDWCGKNDPYWEIERRQPWKAEGHTPVTMEFCRLLQTSEQIAGLIAGHTHKQCLDLFNGRFQLTLQCAELHTVTLSH